MPYWLILTLINRALNFIMKKNLQTVLLSLFFHFCFYASNDSEKATKKKYSHVQSHIRK